MDFNETGVDPKVKIELFDEFIVNIPHRLHVFVIRDWGGGGSSSSRLCSPCCHKIRDAVVMVLSHSIFEWAVVTTPGTLQMKSSFNLFPLDKMAAVSQTIFLDAFS